MTWSESVWCSTWARGIRVAYTYEWSSMKLLSRWNDVRKHRRTAAIRLSMSQINLFVWLLHDSHACCDVRASIFTFFPPTWHPHTHTHTHIATLSTCMDAMLCQLAYVRTPVNRACAARRHRWFSDTRPLSQIFRWKTLLGSNSMSLHRWRKRVFF